MWLHDANIFAYSWYCHLQNDCKNVYSTDYVSAKGAFAEDVRNGEYSYPVILALFSKQGDAIRKAFATKEKTGRPVMEKAMKALQQEDVQSVCLNELNSIAATIPDFVRLWGRKEKMNGQGTMKW